MYGNYFGQPAAAPQPGQMQNPYLSRLMAYQPPQYQGAQLIRVNGTNGAAAYPVSPGSTVALFDESSDTMYIKSADAGGYPTIRTFRFEEIKAGVGRPAEYVTRQEFEELKGMIFNAQHTVSEPASETRTAEPAADVTAVSAVRKRGNNA